MSKGNIFLGYARGKVGDVVFTRADGEQVTRARNRSPKNPKTARQAVQRSILKTVSQAYAVLAPICDHSFEGLQQGTPNQSRFSSLNIAMLRSMVLANVNMSDPDEILASELYNFATRDMLYPVINPYIVSAGSLPTLYYSFGTNDRPTLSVPGFTSSSTYQNIVDALGLERGDQLTFLWTYARDNEADWDGLISGFEYSRVILDPSNGDMGTVFVDTLSKGPSSPNAANQGRIYLAADTGTLGFTPTNAGAESPGSSRVISGCAVIVSRHFGSMWRRSPQSLIMRTDLDLPYNSRYLGDAALTFMEAANGSSLYLNQAENF